MNRLIATVTKIVPLKRLNLIKLDFNGQNVNMLILEMNLDLKEGKKVELIVKPTAVSVLDKECGFENVLKGKLKHIKKGEILSSVTVDVGGVEIESIMLREKAVFDNDVYVVFKANDIAVSKVIDD